MSRLSSVHLRVQRPKKKKKEITKCDCITLPRLAFLSRDIELAERGEKEEEASVSLFFFRFFFLSYFAPSLSVSLLFHLTLLIRKLNEELHLSEDTTCLEVS